MVDLTELEDHLAALPSPGILVLTPALRLLHMNRQAWELTRELNALHGRPGPANMLPLPLIELGTEVVKLLRLRHEAEDWEQFEIRCTTGPRHRPILLRGYGLPHREGITESRVLIVMERMERAAQAEAA